MDSFEVSATDRTPGVLFDFEKNHLKLTGESYPEDATRFYAPVFEALHNYLNGLTDEHCRFDFELIYFNSSSAKALIMLMEMLDKAAKAGNRVDVHWFFDPEDDTMEELGEEFGEDLDHASFHLEKMPA